MPIHVVRNPFYSRIGQFEEGKQTLVVGIDKHALETQSPYKFRIGSNQTIYEADSSEVLTKGHLWTNKKGKVVVIVPVNLFNKRG